jgi:citrate lyase subunit beta/citryl-CoA lyase
MKTIRSFLFVPGDSERKAEKAVGSAADALILDLEDAVIPERLGFARGFVRDFLKSRPDRTKQQLWVRVNPISTPLALADLAAVVPGAPDGILLPKADSSAEAVTLDHFLSALETREGVALGATRIIPVATETAQAMFALNSYAGATLRLAGMTWGAEDLATAVGASTNRLENGEYEFTFRLARTLCLLGAAAAGVPAIDTIWTNFRDPAGLKADAMAARRAGFFGKIAIHPDQIEIINASFTPDAGEIDFARRVVKAFAEGSGAGAVQLEGKMLDRPHLKQAQRVLQLADQLTS